MDEHGIYKRIGEFVVCFQFIENKLREIGQYILDPARKVWPPQALRRESSKNLAKKWQSFTRTISISAICRRITNVSCARSFAISLVNFKNCEEIATDSSTPPTSSSKLAARYRHFYGQI